MCRHGSLPARLRLVQLPRHEGYFRLAKTDSERLAAYRALFRPHMDLELIDAIREATNGNYVLGGKNIQREMRAAEPLRHLPSSKSDGVEIWNR